MRTKVEDLRQMSFDLQAPATKVPAPVDTGAGETSSIDWQLRAALKSALEQAHDREADPLDRVEVAARMSRMLGREITKSLIDGWVAPSRLGYRIHADALVALCWVLGDTSPFETLADAMGLKALTPDLAACAEYGAAMAVRRSLDSKMKGLQQDMDDPDLIERLTSRMIPGGKA